MLKTLRTELARGAAILLALGIALPAASLAQAVDPTAAHMRSELRDFLTTLSRSEQGTAQSSSEEYRRFRWSYEGGERYEGMMLGGLRQQQQQRFFEFLASALGVTGTARLDTVLASERRRAEERLQAADPADDEYRDPLAYRFALFGAPSRFGEWSWRFQGHHVSLSFVVREDRVVATTPAFFGAQPARVELPHGETIRAMAAEEDGGRELLATLSDRDREWTVLSPVAPGDIQSGSHWAPRAIVPVGLRYGAMSEEQQRLLWALVGVYAARWTPELAAAELARIEDAGRDDVRFAWAGSTQPGEPHYYRIQGPTFIIEYSTVDGDPDHVHTVWRDFERDFGGRVDDLLGATYDPRAAPMDGVSRDGEVTRHGSLRQWPATDERCISQMGSGVS